MKEEFCRPLADRFEVSREAMRIRLEQLGLLVLKKGKHAVLKRGQRYLF
jgi:Zn-dependent peptidase ImmA (M78 family)